jgi:Protein of unknown function (DUF998)
MKRFVTTYALLSPYIFVVLYLIIGFATPGYSHLKHTISRLSIGRYGFWESLNILQFSFGIMTMIFLTREHIKNSKTVRQISYMLGAIALTLILIAIFPTDPIDAFPQSMLSISWSAITHFAILGLFVLCTPVIVIKLYDALNQDSHYKDLAPVTGVCGYLTFILSITWFLFFYFGILNSYRGLFQKFIAMIVLFWITKITKRIASVTLNK